MTSPSTIEHATRATTAVADVRVLTANVQSFPADAMTRDQALEDLRRNAEVADVVLLQEIAERYRPLVAEAFPVADWEVYYGAEDNSEPIAYRRDHYEELDAGVSLLHPAVAKVHFRRHLTHLFLRDRASGLAFHVTNLHLVAGAFAEPPHANRALRVREWHAGVAKHLTQVDAFVSRGEPVIGGGDYNRRLGRFPSLGSEVDGKPVKYAVDPKSIDLLWCVDGDEHGWSLVEREVFPGREGKRPQRNSDHAARLAHLRLGGATSGLPFFVPGAVPEQRKPARKKPAKRPVAEPARESWPPPFEKTLFGDTDKKTVDWKTRAALEEAERRLGYTLTVLQGSYNTTVKASARTHWKGGVVDLAPYDHERKVSVLRELGFAAWYRPKSSSWNPHIHAVMVDHGNLHPEAAAQVEQYRKGTDGLAGHRPDPTPRPSPIPVFAYPPAAPRQDTVPAVPAVPAVPDVPAAPVPRDAPGSAYPPRRTLDGVDTSHHQGGRLDLRKAQLAGLRFWYLKATDGETFVDPTYRKRVRQARKAGIPVGAYHFARPDGGDAQKEAAHFLATAQIGLGDMVPMLDLEGHVKLDRAQLTRWVGVWVSTVRAALAAKGLEATPVVYTSFDLDDTFGCKLWVARYSNDFRAPRIPQPWQRAAIWQHSDGRTGPIRTVPGLGAVDVNALHPDLPLDALRVRRLGSARGGTDSVRRDLLEARRLIDGALARLDGRTSR
jgi:GH25 family lysozyme M1 (1,4-beta-N-acetylmuramidase)